MNKIIEENAKPGTPASEWDIDIVDVHNRSIQGFATEMSVNIGETVHFKIDTNATAYRLDIYRMGYYDGNGARKVATVQPSVALPQLQPPGLSDATGLLDCGKWVVSASWAVPADAASGIYFAKLVREDGQTGANHIFFVVRDDDGNCELLFQASDTTWQAYNTYNNDGKKSFYLPSRETRSFKVSYNRPFDTRHFDEEKGANWVFNAEYPMIRWLEANGYDVTYCSGADTDRFGAEMLQHKIFLSVGHDEYWSAQQRVNIEAARDAGVHLAFFSGNEVYWKIRWEDSIDGSNTPYRTLVCYKETHANAKIDPTPAWTGTWRDPRFSPPSDGGRPENALTGTMFGVQGFSDHAILVSAEEGRARFWRNTHIANLAPGQTVSLTTGTLGYEWDQDVDNGFRPAGLIRLSSTIINFDTPLLLLDHGNTFGPGTATHHLTLYRHSSGALVFGAGTVQLTWALDNHHDTQGRNSGTPDQGLQQAIVNLFADMGVQPGSLQPGLVPASASTDTTPPTSTILFPTHGDILQPGQPMTITGTASDVGGVVGAVEVSVDGGLTWHPANGRENWSYPWTPSGNGLVTILSRAVDDSCNLESPSTGIDVIIGEATDVGTGGPILVIVNGSYSAKNPFGNYLSEILRAEGLVAFTKIELTMLMREADPLSFLNTFRLVLLAETRLLPHQQQLIRAYVSGGGNLIAMRPDPALADLFGLSFVNQRTEIPGQPQFFALDTASGPGTGLTSVSLQYHGDADNYALAGAVALASCWDGINTPGEHPAVTLNAFGNGRAAAFTFDLAKSVVLMRQGNANWKDSEGDGTTVSGFRPADMFARIEGDIWFEPQRLRIPQADEEQRFLANLILHLTDQPMPRLWYLPARHKWLIINTGDSCFSNRSKMERTVEAANEFGPISLYLMHGHIGNEIDAVTEQKWRAVGNEVGGHVFDDTEKQKVDTLRDAYSEITTKLQQAFDHGARSARNHTVEWVGWVDMAKIEAEFGTRLDLNYYHYFQFSAKSRFPSIRTPADKDNATGYFTGSGLAQRFCDENGAILPIYQLLTEWSDEFFFDNSPEGFPGAPAPHGFTVPDVVNAIKAQIAAAETGYYSAFVMHTHPARFIWWDGPEPNPPAPRPPEKDFTHDWATVIWAHAKEQRIPVLSAEGFLNFVEARNNARFDSVSWDGATLAFDFQTPNAGQELTIMLPADSLISIQVGDDFVDFTTEILMGRNYALFSSTAVSAHVVASYGQV